MPGKSGHNASLLGDELVPIAELAEGAWPAGSPVDGFQTAHVATIGLAHGLNDTYTSFLAPLLPALIAKLAMSKTQAGMLAFVQSSPSLFQPVTGHLADRSICATPSSWLR